MRAQEQKPTKSSTSRLPELPKCPTGIRGLDEITNGGLPRGRPTLVCGGAGCGKTLLGMEFLVRGAIQFDEPGVCLSFEETREELAANIGSLGFDLDALAAAKKIAIDHIYIERSLVEETGEYDLEALFVRLDHAVRSVGARRVLVDSVEALFGGLPNEAILRSELRRLFRWLKDRKLTAVITGERGVDTLTRHGLEEYISDCVIVLDHRIVESVSTRRIRVAKYRGASHGTNEYPFLIDTDGISVLPITSLGLEHQASSEVVSTGIPALDRMLGAGGVFRGSTTLISGTAGTGKTSIMAHFADAACARGERAVVFSFEESASQLIRNMRSIGIDLGQWVDRGLLKIEAVRPTTLGLERHLVRLHQLLEDFRPSVAAVDPITALLRAGSEMDTGIMLMRLVDFMKVQQITALVTTLIQSGEAPEAAHVMVSSLADAWLVLRDHESGSVRSNGLVILKCRGQAHSKQVRKYRMTNRGILIEEDENWTEKPGNGTGRPPITAKKRLSSKAGGGRK